MDKFNKFLKAWKFIGIVAMLALVLFLTKGCGSKTNIREETHDKLEYISEELGYLKNLYYENEEGTYYDLQDALYNVYVKCDELQDVVDNLSYKYREQEYDDDRERRSWWY